MAAPAEFSSLSNELLYQIVTEVLLLEVPDGVIEMGTQPSPAVPAVTKPIFRVSSVLQYMAFEIILKVSPRYKLLGSEGLLIGWRIEIHFQCWRQEARLPICRVDTWFWAPDVSRRQDLRWQEGIAKRSQPSNVLGHRPCT